MGPYGNVSNGDPVSDSHDAMMTHVLDLKKDMGNVLGRLDRIQAAIDGGGQPGLQQRVALLEKTKNRLVGAWWTISGIISFLGYLLGSHKHR